MSLRKRPTITSALLAANRANGQKSRGPRTVRGKDRIVLNALKHGRHARNFRDHLLRARSKEDAELFQWILDQLHTGLRFRGWQGERQVERLARQVWCALGEEERRAHAAAREFGKGRVKFRRRSASLWALALDPVAAGRGPERTRNMP